MIISYRAICISVERNDGIDEIPGLLVVRMEDVSPILMDVDTFHLLTVYISAKMRPLLNDQAAFTISFGEMSECRAEETGSDNQIIES